MKRRQQQGFTLVEIAIVLVIIGLLLGGILKGQEMITQAKIKNVIGDFSGISAAFYGYQDRYRQLPGDDACAGTTGINAAMCGTAVGRWQATTESGGGNGRVFGYYNSASNASPFDESRLWWQHLRLAGFVSGQGVTQPFNTFAGVIGVQTGDGGNGLLAMTGLLPALGSDATGTGGLPGLIICSSNLPDTVAIATDTQMDDGIRTTGSVRAQLNTAPTPNIVANAQGAAVGAANSYVQSGTNIYTMCRGL
jgi:prepilin-type N-terminal cleavage/methylation domain-containing protein